MGKHILQQKPRAMPSAERVAQVVHGMAKPFLVSGCRSSRRSLEPIAGEHDAYRFAGGGIGDLAGKNVMCFVHGYNLTADESMGSARDFFDRLTVAMGADGIDLNQWAFLLFTWPGDTGTLHFNPAQAFAQFAGAALFDLIKGAGAARWSIATHSLGAHVALHAAAILGERLYHQREVPRIARMLLLGASVEDDVFERPQRHEEYHFPEAAFAIEQLHFSVSRSDEVLAIPFLLNEADQALGFCGPESMSPLQSLVRRVGDVLPGRTFHFEQHDFSPRSATIFNPELHVHRHNEYWARPKQLAYYVNLLK